MEEETEHVAARSSRSCLFHNHSCNHLFAIQGTQWFEGIYSLSFQSFSFKKIAIHLNDFNGCVASSEMNAIEADVRFLTSV